MGACKTTKKRSVTRWAWVIVQNQFTIGRFRQQRQITLKIPYRRSSTKSCWNFLQDSKDFILFLAKIIMSCLNRITCFKIIGCSIEWSKRKVSGFFKMKQSFHLFTDLEELFLLFEWTTRNLLIFTVYRGLCMGTFYYMCSHAHIEAIWSMSSVFADHSIHHFWASISQWWSLLSR
jgi:hypothetical protein